MGLSDEGHCSEIALKLHWRSVAKEGTIVWEVPETREDRVQIAVLQLKSMYINLLYATNGICGRNVYCST